MIEKCWRTEGTWWLSVDGEGVREKFVLESAKTVPRESRYTRPTDNRHRGGREHVWYAALCLPLRGEIMQERTVVMDSSKLMRIQTFQVSPEHSKHVRIPGKNH